MKKTALNTLFVLLLLLLSLCFAIMLDGCSAPRVVVQTKEVQVHDTLRVDVWRTDSVYVSKMIKAVGDTIVQRDTLIKYQYIDKGRERVVYETRVDSIPYEVEVTKYVRKRNTYDKVTAAGFWLFAVFALLVMAWRLLKRYYFMR